MSAEFRIPPHSIPAEQALLGAILVSPRVYETVAEYLLPEHFAEPMHGRIFAACGKLVDSGNSPEAIAIATMLRDDESLAAYEGGASGYLAALMGGVVIIKGAEAYGKQILDHHMRRDGIAICAEATADFYDGNSPNATAVFEALEARIAAATQATIGDDRSVAMAASLDATLAQIEAARKARADGGMLGITTGLDDLDRATGGMRKSDLIILAGRPSMGKSAMAYGIAIGAAKAGHPVFFASLEMSHTQLTNRGISAESGIPGDRAEQGIVSDHDFARINDAAERLRGLPLVIDDTPGLTPQGLRTRARRMKRRQGLGLVVVDYLQLMRLADKSENRVQEISKITASLKGLAKELDVPVVALSQLSRALESREDKRPMLSDLRESGSIEQDADVVMFVFRPEYYLEREEPQARSGESDDKLSSRMTQWQARVDECRGKAECIIAKQRRGSVGKVDLAFTPELVKFGNLYRGGN